MPKTNKQSGNVKISKNKSKNELLNIGKKYKMIKGEEQILETGERIVTIHLSTEEEESMTLIQLAKKMDKGFDEIKKEIVEIKTDVNVLKNDVNVLKNDVNVLKSDVAIIKTDIVALKANDIKFAEIFKKHGLE